MAPPEDPSSTISAPPERSLYDALGGAGTVREAVERFYVRVLDDPSLVSFFDDVDLQQVKRHQALVIAGILGGPQEYQGLGLRAAHAALHVTDSDYDRVGEHLISVLDEMGAGPEAATTVAAALEQVRADIVTAAPLGA